MAVEAAFDELIHVPTRLRICGLLRHVEEIEFSVLRDALDVTDASLSKHLRVLLDADYAAITKAASPHRSDARRLTWVRLTPAGSRAFDAHVEEVRLIATGADGSPGEPVARRGARRARPAPSSQALA